MPRTFSVVSTQEPGALVERARRAASENNADFRGNEASGSFSGSGVEGVYRMDGRVVTVTITQKPFFAPWPIVESGLKRFLV